MLLGVDMAGLGRLLDDGVVDNYVVLSTLNYGEREVPQRIAHLVRLAPVLIPRGVDATRLARTAELGGWTGDESANYEALRVAFQSVETEDPSVLQVREAGISLFERQRNEALIEERARRVAGDL
jgi:hypothetical protein